MSERLLELLGMPFEKELNTKTQKTHRNTKTQKVTQKH
jgi:hypothetical protein